MPAGRPVESRCPNVLIVGDFAFPYGTGASSRVFNYARGLQAAGARVKVLCVEPGGRGDATLNNAARGDYRGVPFEYTYGRTTRPSSATHRRFLKLAKWPRFIVEVRRCASEVGSLDAMLVYSRSLPWIAVAWLSCRLLGATLLHEDCELPFVWKAETPATRAKRWLYHHIVFRAFDGCLVISTYLERYCRSHLRASAGTLLVPILVDVDDVAAHEDAEAPGATSEGDRIAYCGYMNHPEVRTAVEAFAVVAKDFPGLSLQLIGGALRPDAVPELEEHIRLLGLASRVELVGKVSRDELFRLFAAAHPLASQGGRPRSRRRAFPRRWRSTWRAARRSSRPPSATSRCTFATVSTPTS